MTEKRATYKIDRPDGPTLEDLAKKDCAREYIDLHYEPPTPDDVSTLIKLAGWSQNEAANIVGANSNSKGSTTIRKWRTQKGEPEHRAIPYAAWRLMLITAGVVKQQKIVGKKRAVAGSDRKKASSRTQRETA